MIRLDAAVASRLYEQSGGARWRVSPDRLREALEHGLARTFGDSRPTRDEIASWASSVHVADLALACACADGHDEAWEHFIRQYRPALYRAASAIDPGGGRELADSLYADLFGIDERNGVRQSLFRYFYGRSTLVTWLRAVLAQRHIDRLRAARRTEALPDDESVAAPAADTRPDIERQRFSDAMRRALTSAVAALAPRDRLRLGCYYVQHLTLAAIGRLLGEHEASASRHLSRTRDNLRDAVTRHLRDIEQLDDEGIAQCVASMTDDPGSLDLREFVGAAAGRKNSAPDRSS